MPIEARRDPLVARVIARLRGPCRIALPTKLVLGISGGADSTALLMAMATWRERHATGHIEIRAVHVNHRLRPTSDSEAKAVSELCEELGVACSVIPIDVPREGNIEASARAARYAALDEVAREFGAEAIVVAHHAEDQLETMLMALGRGAGLDGLSTMGWRRESGDAAALVRPLLDTRKRECEALCDAARIKWIVDASNFDVDRTRSRLRRDVLPVFESLWPDAARRCVAASEAIGAAAVVLESAVEVSFGPPSSRTWARASIARLPEPIIAAGLRRAGLDAVPSVADQLGQRQLLQAARAIRDDAEHPRRFRWAGGLELLVTSRAIELSVTRG